MGIVVFPQNIWQEINATRSCNIRPHMPMKYQNLYWWSATLFAKVLNTRITLNANRVYLIYYLYRLYADNYAVGVVEGGGGLRASNSFKPTRRGGLGSRPRNKNKKKNCLLAAVLVFNVITRNEIRMFMCG